MHPAENQEPNLGELRIEFEMPEGACDCHFHIFGPFCRFPLNPNRSFEPPEATVQDCLLMHKALGISRGVLIHSGAYGIDLNVSIHALNVTRERWRGIALVQPGITDGEIEQLATNGFTGIRLNIADGIDVPESIDRMAPLLKRHGWHIEILTHLDGIPALASSIERAEVPCVIDHMGYSTTSQGVNHLGFRVLVDLIGRGCCWTKLSGANRVGANSADHKSAKLRMQELVAANPNALVWGSDWPHVRLTEAPNEKRLLNLFAECVPDDSTRRKILVTNPAKLYNF